MKKLIDMTIGECEEYYKTCGRKCWEQYCPLHTGGGCILDFTGKSNDDYTDDVYKRQLGQEFDPNMTIGELVDLIRERRV